MWHLYWNFPPSSCQKRNEPVEELRPVLGLELDDGAVEVVQSEPTPRPLKRLLEGLAQKVLPRTVVERGNARHEAHALGLVQGRGEDQWDALEKIKASRIYNFEVDLSILLERIMRKIIRKNKNYEF